MARAAALSAYTLGRMPSSLRSPAAALLVSAVTLAGCPRRAAPVVENTPIISTSTPSDAGARDGGDFLSGLFAMGAAAVQLTRDALDPYARRPNTGDAWSWHAMDYRDRAPSSFEHRCPPNGTLSNSVWGTMIYTDDSSICTAAVHSGVITREAGGTVRVYVHGPRNGFVGSGDHDVLTRSYRWFPGSFAFTESVPEDVFPPPVDGGPDGAAAR